MCPLTFEPSVEKLQKHKKMAERGNGAVTCAQSSVFYLHNFCGLGKQNFFFLVGGKCKRKIVFIPRERSLTLPGHQFIPQSHR